jgi:hypothetical protein
MPIPVKPCDGSLSDDLQAVLTRNREREQWALHTCQACGAAVGVVQVHGKWVPEQHWPSVTYASRHAAAKSSDRTAKPHQEVPDPSPVSSCH